MNFLQGDLRNMESGHRLDYILTMKRYRISLMTVSFLALLPGLLFAADSLWDRVMSHTAPENTEKALTMTMLSHERNRSGKVTKITEIIFVWNDGTDDFILLSATENGKDVTDRVKRKAERRNENDRSIYAHQMFNPEKADGLILEPRDVTAVIDGRECRIYDFRFENEWPMGPGKPKPVVEEGMIFIDLEYGMPLRLTSTVSEGPSILKSFSYRMDAGPGPVGLWRIADVEMEFVGQKIVYMAGGFTMSFDYGD